MVPHVLAHPARGQLIVTEQGIRESVRQAIIPLWNSWYFFQLYANAAGYDASRRVASSNLLDRYLLAKVRELTETAQWQLGHYEVANACDTARGFLDVLTNWSSAAHVSGSGAPPIPIRQ